MSDSETTATKKTTTVVKKRGRKPAAEKVVVVAPAAPPPPQAVPEDATLQRVAMRAVELLAGTKRLCEFENDEFRVDAIVAVRVTSLQRPTRPMNLFFSTMKPHGVAHVTAGARAETPTDIYQFKKRANKADPPTTTQTDERMHAALESAKKRRLLEDVIALAKGASVL